MKNHRTFRYTDKNWFIVSIETKIDYKNLINYFGLPENAVLEWLDGREGEILTGAHRVRDISKTKRYVDHYALRKGNSTVAWTNYNG